MQDWLWLSFVAPFFWAVVAIIDIQFVDDVYKDEYDGTVVSGIFQLLPWLLVPLGIIEFQFPAIDISLLAFLSGGMFILSFFFYFKALFVSNDGALMEILWGTSVLVVPFFAWLLIDEALKDIHYIGIFIAFLGICLFNFDGRVRRIGFSKILVPMIGAITFLSLSMVITKKVQQPSEDFWSLFLIFSTGAAIFSFALLFLGKKNPLEKSRMIVQLIWKYGLFFLIAEGLSNIATFASQKAISLAPSVSFVIVIESLVPVFVMAISLFVVFLFWNSKRFNVTLYQNQISGAWIKIPALSLIIVGIFLVV